MKIGLIGTSCSGKTTLAKQLSEHFKFTLVEEIAREYFVEFLSLESTQYEILFKQIQREMWAGKNVVTDRTVIDNYIHTVRSFKPKKHLLKFVCDWAQTYDIILLCKKLPFVDDGFRVDVNMENDMIQFMKNNLIDFEIIDGNEIERFETAKKLINRKI